MKRKHILGVSLVLGIMAGSTLPAAAVSLDCTAGCTGEINGALFTTDAFHPAGTGYIEPFVRISSNDSEEEGTNTYQPVMLDEHAPSSWMDVPMLSLDNFYLRDGETYVKFLLDINEPAADGKSELVLEDMIVYTDENDQKYPYPAQSDSSLMATELWNLDSAGDSQVLLDYNYTGGGSGWGDLSVFVPVSTSEIGNYLYLFSRFTDNDNNFEEWALAINPNPIPEPATMFLFGTGIIGLVGAIRRRNKK